MDLFDKCYQHDRGLASQARAAQEMGTKGIWPKSHYIVRFDQNRCNHCGVCVKRCHFDAFYHDGSLIKVNGKRKKAVTVDFEKCWGCGLCANTCPQDAIQMIRLEDEPDQA